MTQTELELTASHTGKWKRYPKYKDSGVEWLGEIPVSWEVKRLRFICQINPSKSEISHYPDDTEVSFLPMELIGEDGTISLEETRRIEQVRQGYTYFRDGDVVIAKITPCFENGKGALCKGLVNGVGFGTTELHVLRIHEENAPNFIFYLTTSKPFREIGAAMMQGAAGQQRVPEEFIKDFRIGLPSLPEQRAIAAFLDHETARINTLIAKKERLIELLQEKRAALISHAVTKGLDASVPMKDSGVEWLGEIPAHWRIGKIGTECTVKARLGWKGLKAAEYVDEGYIFLATPNIKGKEIDFENVNHITPERYFESPEIMLKEGDVLIAKDGSTLGITAVIRDLPAPTTVNSSIAVIRPHELLDSVFLYWFLSSNYIQEFIQSMKDGMGVPHLFQADLRKFIVLTPTLSEQQTIAAYIDHETARIDALITGIGEGIEKLKEYSAALVSAAVTGKIDVRDVVSDGR